MKSILIGLFITLNIHAQTYEYILEQAIKNSRELNVLKSQQEQVSLQGQIERRYKNPNIEFEVADFSSEFLTKRNDFGVKVAVRQSILLPHIIEEKRQITEERVDVARESYALERSDFIYRFNLKYLAHKKVLAKIALHHKVVEISNTLLTTVKHRYEAGSIAKSEYLTAKLEQSKLLNQGEALKIELLEAKNTLLSFSNISNEIEVDAQHHFLVSNRKNSPALVQLNEARERVSQAKIELLTHSTESIELFSELEQEPDQDVFRVGFSIDLPTFNLHDEEKQLEKINISNQRISIAQRLKAIEIQLEQLNNEKLALNQLNMGYGRFIGEQRELFEMYKRSYDLAKVNLIKLQELLKNIITTEEKILENNFVIEQKNIKINYLQGAYHE